MTFRPLLRRPWALASAAWLKLALSALATAACSSPGQDSTASGGQMASGGSTTGGGPTSTGGVDATGGSASGATGGVVADGGGTPAGGAGGTPGTGGTSEASGGGATTGGASGSTAGAGGMQASGGSGGTTGDDLKTFVYVGSGDWTGSEEGLVTVFELDRATQQLTWKSEHPAGGLASFLAIDTERLRLFVADEGDGGVISFSIDAQSGELTPLGAQASGNNPVYLTLSADGAYLLAANYTQGNVDVFPIGADGIAQAPTVTQPTGNQAHCVVLDDDNNVFVANKASDTISHFTFNAGELTAGNPPTTALTSPRHIFLDPEARAYVISEEADLISVFSRDSAGALQPLWQGPRLPAGGTPATDTGADIRVTPSGKFLYATNRGSSNTIVAYDLTGAEPVLIEHESSQGTTPRNFAIDPLEEFLIVGNHGTQKSLATFKINADGSLELSEALPLTISPFFVGIVRL